MGIRPSTNLERVGPAAIPAVVGNIKTAPVSLWGPRGAPDFDRITGSRIVSTSAWCVTYDSIAAGQWHADGLLYDATSQTFGSPSAGVPVCLPG